MKALLNKSIHIIPPLDGSLHKGQSGRVGVVGGSRDYTGAPFFSSYAALRLGADLSHVICDPIASTVIKTYSPDLIVHSFLSSSSNDQSTYKSHQNEFKELISRLHVLIIGPGLGRDQEMQDWAKFAIQICQKLNTFLVLDADALWLIQSDPDLIRNYKKVILTPNHVEFQRLLKSCSIETINLSESDLAKRLSKSLGGCTVLQKGASDLIACDGFDSILIDTNGSPKRCGGQGDILSGLVGTWLAWGKLYLDKQTSNLEQINKDEKIKEEEIILISASLGSKITRTCSNLTFNKFGRSMQTSDMLNFINQSFEIVSKGLLDDEKSSKM